MFIWPHHLTSVFHNPTLWIARLPLVPIPMNMSHVKNQLIFTGILYAIKKIKLSTDGIFCLWEQEFFSRIKYSIFLTKGAKKKKNSPDRMLINLTVNCDLGHFFLLPWIKRNFSFSVRRKCVFFDLVAGRKKCFQLARKNNNFIIKTNHFCRQKIPNSIIIIFQIFLNI